MTTILAKGRDANEAGQPVEFRPAAGADVPVLAAMRSDYRLEETGGAAAHDKEAFLAACEAFLRQGLAGGSWTVWIAVRGGEIVSHVYVQRIAKVPKPNCLEDAFGYLTNVYTRPAWRGQGIGSELLRHVLAWAETTKLEMLLVWPAERSIQFYRRAGFEPGSAMEREIRPYVP